MQEMNDEVAPSLRQGGVSLRQQQTWRHYLAREGRMWDRLVTACNLKTQPVSSSQGVQRRAVRGYGDCVASDVEVCELLDERRANEK